MPAIIYALCATLAMADTQLMRSKLHSMSVQSSGDAESVLLAPEQPIYPCGDAVAEMFSNPESLRAAHPKEYVKYPPHLPLLSAWPFNTHSITTCLRFEIHSFGISIDPAAFSKSAINLWRSVCSFDIIIFIASLILPLHT